MPSLTSDEESGSTTSSCEEDPTLTIETDQADNAKKVEVDGYASSETISADETGEPVGAPQKARQGALAPPGGRNMPESLSIRMDDLMKEVITNTLGGPGRSGAVASVAPVLV